jgi:endonuclease/exonuclease/phosphatase (EEP) superfamily protein YafD
MAAGAGWLADRLAPFDLANDFLPVWFGGGMIAAVLIVIARGRMLAVILCAGILVISALPPLIREIHKPPSRPGSGHMLTLVQFNVLKSNRTPRAVAEWLLREHPDIITMAETLGTNRTILQRLRSAYPYQVSCLSRMRCSTVILSRLRPLASGGLARGDPENQQALSAAWARFAGTRAPFTVVAVHMVRPWPWGDQTSGRRQLAEFLSGIDRRRAIVTGDFNLTPWTVAMQHQDRLFGLDRQTRFLPTWPVMIDGIATPAVMPIDHVYTGSDWRMVAIQRGISFGSDHSPVLVTLDGR